MTSTSNTGARKITGYASTGKGAELKKWAYDAPALGLDDVEIAVSHCGICHSDLHTLDSGWGPTKYPVIVGHEIVGTVSAVGSSVTHLKIGDRVGVGAQCGACGRCRSCLHGKDNLCDHTVFTYNAKHPSGRAAYGGYAEAVRLPANYAFLLPENLPSDVAAPLLCAGATVYAPLKRHMRAGARVGVVGVGGLGHLAIQFARALGARTVVGLSQSGRKAADAEALGATDFAILDSPAAFAKHAGSLDLIVCTVSSHELAWSEYIKLLDVQGKFVVVGLPEEPIKLDLGVLIGGERSLVGSLIGSRAEIEDMLELAAEKKVFPWIEKVPIAEVNGAIERLRRGDVKYRFVLEN
ncbi:chaperonin 10-like protein [Blastocladiella britannica]|nr:chaperonin 10-like protein [Blastocladiella britannica]